MPNIEGVGTERLTTGPQADQVTPHTEGAAALERTGYHTDRYFTQIAGDIKGLTHEAEAYTNNITLQQTQQSMATESQMDAQALLGARKAFADDISAPTHDPTLGLTLAQRYNEAVRAGVTQFTTQEGKDEYIKRSNARARAFQDQLVTLEGQASSAQSVIDRGRFEGGVYQQAAIAGMSGLQGTLDAIDAWGSHHQGATPEGAAQVATDVTAMKDNAAFQAASSEIRRSTDPLGTAQSIIDGPWGEYVAKKSEGLMDVAKQELADRRDAESADRRAKQDASTDRMNQYMFNMGKGQYPSRQDIDSDPTLLPDDKDKLKSHLNNDETPTPYESKAFFATNSGRILAAHAAGHDYTDAQIKGLLSSKEATPEMVGQLVELNKLITGRSDTKLPPGSTEVINSTMLYIKGAFAPTVKTASAQANADAQYQSAIAALMPAIVTGLQNGVAPARLLDRTGKDELSVFRQYPLSSFGHVQGAPPAAAKGSGRLPDTVDAARSALLGGL